MLTDLVEVQPLPEYAIALGDARSAAGDRAGATEAYELVDVIADLYRANGRGRRPRDRAVRRRSPPGPDTVAAARKALVDRPSILGHDVLAWNLHRTGKDAEASKEMAVALKTGSRDPLLRFHAAAIADAVGDRDAAVKHLRIVLDTNPRFSAALADDVEQLAGAARSRGARAGFGEPRQSLAATRHRTGAGSGDDAATWTPPKRERHRSRVTAP